MRRSALLLLLLAAPVLAWAGTSDTDPVPKRGACQYAPSGASENAAPAAPQARSASQAASRSAGKSDPASGNAAGGGEDIVLPRARSSNWHSFLPGMFR